MAHVKKKKRRIKYKNIFIFLLFIVIIFGSIFCVANLHITNIYIEGNTFLSDQEIIDISGLHNYPKLYKISKDKINNKLINNAYIESASIKRSHFFREVTITVKENKPLLYYAYDELFLLKDGTRVKETYNLPTLINQTPNDILLKLLGSLSKLNPDILDRISEIMYNPSETDSELFTLSMTDGNTVNVNINTFSKLNVYIDILRRFGDNKGTLNLDKGDYLKTYED